MLEERYRFTAGMLLTTYALSAIMMSYLMSDTLLYGNVNEIFYFFSITGPVCAIIGIPILVLGIKYNTKVSKVVRIAGVLKSVTITQLSQQTGFDRETTIKLLNDAILTYKLFGHIEEHETFIRETDVHPIYPGYDGN